MSCSTFTFAVVLLLAITYAAECRHHGTGDGYHQQFRGKVRSGDHDDGENDHDDTIYRFAIGGNLGPFGYQDDTGALKGFLIDLLYAVCAKADKQCTWTLARSTDCWAGADGSNSELEYPGVGLLAGYFDACLGLVPTMERYNSFNFSISFGSPLEVGVYYLREAEGDLNDLTGKKIGFMSGWMANPKCVARQTSLKGNKAGEYEPVFFKTGAEIAKAMSAGEIDAATGIRILVESRGSSDRVMAAEPFFTCSVDGSALMARYSRMDIIDWWNAAFEELRGTGAFRRLCEQAQRDHGHKGKVLCAL